MDIEPPKLRYFNCKLKCYPITDPHLLLIFMRSPLPPRIVKLHARSKLTLIVLNVVYYLARR